MIASLTHTGQVIDPLLTKDAPSVASTHPGHRQPLARSLGRARIATLLLGSLIILSVIGFIVFLWLGAHASIHEADGNRFTFQVWHRILNSGWLLRLIAISSLLYRVVTAAQAAIATEMLASLMLEGGSGCQLPDLARLSLTRCQTAGPLQLALAMPRQLRSRDPRSLMQTGYLLMLLIVTAATQFTSTILLTDIGVARIISDQRVFDVNFGFDYLSLESSNLFDPYVGVDYWTSRPRPALRFAEKSTPPVELDGVYDTGSTTRAFLPLTNSTQAATVRNYEGPATVIDARVVCIRPRLSGLLLNLVASQTISVAGSIALSGTYQGLETQPSFGDVEFVCPIATGTAHDRPLQRKISLCPLDSEPARMQGGVRPDMSFYTSAYLLINSTAVSETWRARSSVLTRPLTNSDLIELESEGSWQSLRLRDSPAVGIDATLCLTNPIPWDYKISASSSQDGSWDSFDFALRWNVSSGAYNSDIARSLIGATVAPESPEDRGLLRLEAPAGSNWAAANATDAFNTPTTMNYIWSALSTSTQNISLSLSRLESSDEALLRVPHRAHVGLFQDILAHTGGNAALALQALFFTLMQMAYADYAAEFDVPARAAVVFSREAIMPVRWRGFVGFCAVTAAHITLVFYMAIIFIIKTRVSMLGNAWHAIGQVVELAGAETVNNATRRTDKEVAESLRADHQDNAQVRLKPVA